MSSSVNIHFYEKTCSTLNEEPGGIRLSSSIKNKLEKKIIKVSVRAHNYRKRFLKTAYKDTFSCSLVRTIVE